MYFNVLIAAIFALLVDSTLACVSIPFFLSNTDYTIQPEQVSSKLEKSDYHGHYDFSLKKKINGPFFTTPIKGSTTVKYISFHFKCLKQTIQSGGNSSILYSGIS